MTVHSLLITYAYRFTGMILLICGALWLPDTPLPANEIASWTHPAVLVMYAGFLGLLMSAVQSLGGYRA